MNIVNNIHFCFSCGEINGESKDTDKVYLQCSVCNKNAVGSIEQAIDLLIDLQHQHLITYDSVDEDEIKELNFD